MRWMTKQSVILLLFFTMCAGFASGMPGRAQASQDTKQVTQGKLAAIESIGVERGDESAELVIRLTAPATYTSYKTTDPLRLVIDLSLTSPGAISFPLALNRGNFKNVVAKRFDTEAGVLTRIQIELARDAEAVLTASPQKPGELRIAFPSLATSAAPAVSPQPTPLAAEPAASEKGSVAGSAATPEKTPEAGLPVEKSASAVVPNPVLKSISSKNNTIILAISGGAREIKSFRLSKPERFVLDLFGVKSALETRLIPVNVAGVASARLGVYPDKLRVVFDAINGAFPETTAAKSSEGVTLTLGTAVPQAHPVATAGQKPAAVEEPKSAPQAPKAQMPSAGEPKTGNTASEKPKAESKPATPQTAARTATPPSVEMVDFQVVDGISRVAVKVAGDVSTGAPEKTAGFVTLTIKNAYLPKSLQRSLETKSFVSPILRVTPIMVKTKKGFDTKIRIAMRAAAAFDFRQEGDMLYVDFKNPPDMTAPDQEESRPQMTRGAKAPTGKASELSAELSAPADAAVKAPGSMKPYKGRKVTLEFADAEVRKIFQLLSEVSNKNFVLGDDVTGTISIKLVNVPWDQALDIILDTKGLDKREEGNIIIIKGRGKFKSQAEEEQEIKKALTRSIELKTETFSVNYADTAGIATQFASLKTDRGTITQDARTNKVIVKDIPQVLNDMRNLIQQLDVPEKQVMIEARIVEATSTFTRNLGVNWGIHYRDGSASFLGINQLDTGFGGLTSAPPTSGTGTSAGGSMGISFGTLTSNIQLDMRLNAAASAGLIKIVSTPKVATLNNKTAKITQGQQIPYTSSTSDKVETKFIEAALALEVTPHINANGTIGMKIDAKNDSPGTSSGGGAPAINKKQATTEMLLRDGETTVIGGIYVDSDTEADDGVPYLMDIPLLGKLFKTNSKSKTKTELLIFITPRILGTI